MPLKDHEARKEYQKKYQKEWYEKNKIKRKKQVLAWNKQHSAKMRIFANTIKEEYGCCNCDESESICLDFHHTSNDKEMSIGEAISKGWSQKRLQAEIDKCIVVCSNCHRKLHAGLISV